MALLQQYSITEIITFGILLAIAIKGFVTFWDWAVEKLRKIFKKETAQEQEKQTLHSHVEEAQEQFKRLANRQEEINQTVQALMIRMDNLIDLNKAQIKSYITEKHHYFVYEQKWIDDYSLDCIEKQYAHYVKEHGNSFVGDLMEELRALPKHPQ